MALQAFHESSEVETAESETEAKAVVILATPALAQWLEDGSGFIKEVLHSLNKKSPSSSGFRREIDVVCACVDGLSPRKLWLSSLVDIIMFLYRSVVE